MSFRVFRPVVVEGFEWVQPLDDGDFDAVYQLDGRSVASTWDPIRMQRLVVDDKGRPLKRADAPWLGGHALVLRDAAYDAVGGVLAGSGEFLELDLVDATDRLWLFNACQIVDALDESSSELVRFPSTGRVMKVKRHVFHADRVAGLVSFRVPQSRSLFITGQTVDVLKASNLSGLEFELVWES